MKKYSGILIIDDDPMMATIMAEMAGPLFDVVQIAYGGEGALTYLAEHEVSIILCDVVMPHMTGDLFLSKLRCKGNQTPVIFITGSPTFEAAVAGLKLGAVDFLEKPVGIESLQKTIMLTLDIENHSRRVHLLEKDDGLNQSAIKSEKRLLGLKQSVRAQKKPA